MFHLFFSQSVKVAKAAPAFITKKQAQLLKKQALSQKKSTKKVA
jgi:hypothetical protein